MDFNVNINNDAGLISNILDIIFSLIAGVISAMKEIILFKTGNTEVSLFSFCIALAIMGIVITYLVNVAKRPSMPSGVAIAKSRSNKE